MKIFDFMGSAMSNPHKHFPQESERKNLSFQNVSEGQEWSPSTILPHFYFLCLAGRGCWRRLVVSARKCIQMAWSLEPNQAIPEYAILTNKNNGNVFEML